MDEFKFVMKTFLITIFILFLLQIKIGTSTVEVEALRWMETSPVTRYLQNVSAGAVLAIRNAGQASSEFITKTFSHQSDTNRASRFNFELKRSPQTNRNQQQNQ